MYIGNVSQKTSFESKCFRANIAKKIPHHVMINFYMHFQLLLTFESFFTFVTMKNDSRFLFMNVLNMPCHMFFSSKGFSANMAEELVFFSTMHPAFVSVHMFLLTKNLSTFIALMDLFHGLNT